MRRQYLPWMILVVAILLVAYGGFFSIREFNSNNSLFVSAVIATSIGGLIIVLFIILSLIPAKKKKEGSSTVHKIEEKEPSESIPEPKIESDPEPASIEESKESERPTMERSETVVRKVGSPTERSSYSSSGYVKRIGYGPVLEIREKRIRDMRNNTYYRIEGGFVYSDGGGLVYEISGNKIRNAFGGPLYEISGSNINKVFGGYFASYSGGRITKCDLSEIYEATCDLNKNMILLVAALLFGGY